MADLVVGHTTPDSTRIWIRGDERYRWARVSLSADGEHRVASEPLKLLGEDDFTAVAPFTNLREETRYRVTARFASSLRGLEQDRSDQNAREGRLRTFPPPDAKASFSFLHGSCNLSIVSLTNLGSLALGALGTVTATESLKRKAHGSRRWKIALWMGDGLVSIIYRGLLLLQVVSFPFRWLRARLSKQSPPRWPKRSHKPSLVYGVFLIVYKLTGFKQKAPLLPNPYKKLNDVLQNGPSNGVDKDLPKEPPPEFMIHAGDQIYFDFPFPQQAPTDAAYRLAYKEAWFEDEQLRRFLSQCPQYMALDDHEIVDGFSTDGYVPKGRDPYEYLEPATQAYSEYVNSRHPTADDSLFYSFDYGTTRFFVMDTRTQRSDHSGEMIDPKQMCRFKE
ncbi:MAG: alkaline phosphatase D family protein, partial [Myxococcota bacterium]